MLFKNIGILDENLDYQSGQWVGVKDGRIAYIGAAAPADADAYGEAYDGAGKLMMPALANAHAHAPMTLLRGYAENLPLQRWLNEKCWPFEGKMTPEDMYWGTVLSCAEMARYGTVSFSDMYYATPERVQAVTEAGMKANLCESELFFEPKPFSAYAICAKMEDFVARYHGAADGRIRMDYNIHAEYTSNPQTCADIAAIAKEKGLPIHLHLSETKSEHEECKQRHDGMTPLAYFESIGVLDVPVTAAHCVWVDDADIEIMVKRGVSAVSNPASNMKLGSGYAPLAQMLDAGVNVCLGTDGMASNNNHDMFADMYLMGLIYKGHALDPAIITPKQVITAATRAGMLSQGREDSGLLKEGFKADLCVLDVTGPQWCPMTDVLCNVVFAGSGSDVVLTMCDGEVIYRDGAFATIDVEKAKAEVSARAKRIIAEL
ncbi:MULTISPECIES: amidohydrolase [unclassified Adlercreutzia]|uniref:amidohydrolase n=1 Tax=unclassified Adlercreutzia TaxID=2636013 RepID=UPI0013EBB685|nr:MULTISPECIES: amidohydrolase [unclassified Adlercreutzia]